MKVVINLGHIQALKTIPPTLSNQKKKNQKLLLTTKQSKKYKSAISVAFKEEVNFAGYYRVAIWGCGTDCRGFAIINKLTGVVYTLPKVEYVAGIMGNDEDRISFNTSSRLFIITGTPNDDEQKEGKYFYEWTGKKLKFITKAPIHKERY